MLRVLELANYNRDIRKDLIDKSDKIYEHLIKIMLYSKSPYVSHWITEIYGFLNKISRSKTNNKYPSYKFIYGALATNLDICNNYVITSRSELKYKYANIPINIISSNTISEHIDNYIKWLSMNLSDHGYVTLDDVYNFIGKNIIGGQ